MAGRIAIVSSLLALLSACDCSEETEGDGPGDQAAAEIRREPAPEPAGLRWIASVSNGAELMDRLRAQLPERARTAMARTPGDVFEAVARAPVGDRVLPNATLWAVGLGGTGGEKIVVAARVRLEDGPQPLGRGVMALSGGPNGSRIVTAEPEGAVTALLGDVLITAPDRDALDAALPYLAFTLVPSEAPAGVHLSAKTPVLRELRGWLDDGLTEAAGDLRRAAERERQRHESAPDLGEPEALITIVERRLRGIVAYLPDVRTLELALVEIGSGFELRAVATISEPSPLFRTLASTPSVQPEILRQLPAGTSFAWLSAVTDDERTWLDTLADVAGERLSDAERQNWQRAETSLRPTRGAAALWLAGSDELGPFVTHAASATAEPDRTAVSRAATGRYVSTLEETLIGCALRPDRGDVVASCQRESAAAALFLHRQGEATALSIGRPAATADRGVLAALRGLRVPQALGSSPDAARVIDALGSDALVAGVIAPGRLMSTATLIPAVPTSGSEPRPGLLAYALSGDGNELVIRIAMESESLGTILALLAPFLDD